MKSTRQLGGRGFPGRIFLQVFTKERPTMTFRVWAVRAGGDSEADPLFIENGQIAVSFRDVDQDVSALPAQRSAFKDAFAQSGEAKPSAIPYIRPASCSASFTK